MKHEEHLDELINHTHIIGINHPIWILKEPKFYQQNNLYTEPDIIIHNGTTYIIEYKHQYRLHTAKKQLQKAKEVTQKHLKIQNPTLLYIYSHKYTIEQIF